MKKFFSILLLPGWLLVLTAAAQTGRDVPPARPLADSSLTADTLSVPLSAPIAPVADFLPFALQLPGSLDRWTGWPLHAGFNAQLGMSVTAGIGRHAPRGAGFGQQVGMMYAAPIGQRVSVAAGLYGDNLTWGGVRQTQVGVMGVVGVNVNDRINVYAYGAKRLTPLRPVSGALMPYFWDRSPDYFYGGAIDFKIGEASHLQISVEARKDGAPLPSMPPRP